MSEYSAATTTAAPEGAARRQLPVIALTAMVVGSMVGAGVFSLPSNFAKQTGVVGTCIVWAIAGTGMLMLALVFQRLAVQKPELNAGVYSYAKAGFGDYVGFFSAFGYWASACAGNATYWILIGSTLGEVIPALGEGSTVLAIAGSSACVWIVHALVLHGIREASVINVIVTIAKLVPIALFILIVAIVGFSGHVFAGNLWQGGAGSSGAGSSTVGSAAGSAAASAAGLIDQVKSTMLITVFVFLGVEGASVYSRYARRRSDVGKATVLGFLSVLAVFALVSILSFGVAPAADLAGMRQPSVAGVLDAVVGPWGRALVSVGLIVSVLGAYLAWTLMGAEVLYNAAISRDAPRFLTRIGRRGAPRYAVLLTSCLVQLLLVVALFSDDAFTFMLDLCSSLCLVPYLLSAAYALKLALSRREATPRASALIIGCLATAYTLFLLVAAGPTFLLLALIVYAPGTVLYVIARRERRLRLFRPAEAALCGLVIAGAIVGVIAVATGAISI
ncbi:basic amino acid/polyamine antiporter [Microbacterium sp. STN6]|uniref:basic amino acid/polyamine antiporter n=1 Tax=Microbacterium sp. STN6 TaxID=2995588 RepID=UPI002260EB73|nr:basic amino acid/polyamine antiporter [Microbacterium sp. STN6]MCX7522892.1 basic amino acid/polyamine antiporter [Microbacterium sp. STN6]